MSTTYRFPTLDADALRSLTEADGPDDSEQEAANQDNISNGIHETLYRENQRLASENAKLRHCLILSKENSDLKSANYVVSSIAWCDDRLRDYMTDVMLVDKRLDDDGQPVSSPNGPSLRFNDMYNEKTDKAAYNGEGSTQSRAISRQTSPVMILNPNYYRQFGPKPDATSAPLPTRPSPAFYHETASRTPRPTSGMSASAGVSFGNETPAGLSGNRSRQTPVKTSSKAIKKPTNGTQRSSMSGGYNNRKSTIPRKLAPGSSSASRATNRVGISTVNTLASPRSPMLANDTAEETPRYLNDIYTATDSRVSSGRYTDQEGFSSNYNTIGQPMAQSTPVNERKSENSTDNDVRYSSTICEQPDSLAVLLGIRGRGAKEIAKSVVYRPVDAITGYRPSLTIEETSQLWTCKPNRRIVGEIAFQLDRRILELIFSGIGRRSSKTKNARYYGYSLTNVMQMIKKESRIGGVPNAQIELQLRERMLKLLHRLAPLGYVLEVHAERSQDMVNRYGLLNGPPDQQTMEYFGLESPVILRILVGQILRDEKERSDMLVILDCLCYLANEDGKPLFMW